MGWVGQGQHLFWWRILLCKIQPQIPPKKRTEWLVRFGNPVRPRKNTAEGGCGGNSATPERIQKADSPAVLLVKSRTPQKSFLFLLEEKNRRAQIKKCEENFFAGWRALASVGGVASLLGVLLKKGSNINQKRPPRKTALERARFLYCFYAEQAVIQKKIHCRA